MCYDSCSQTSSISLTEFARRLGCELDELFENRPMGISRAEMARVLQQRAAVILTEEQSRTRAAAEISALANQIRRGVCLTV